MLTSKQHFINRKIIIMQSGVSQLDVAKKMGITRVGFYKALTCRTKNPKMHQRICDALGVTKEEFFPEFYPNNNGGNGDGAQAT